LEILGEIKCSIKCSYNEDVINKEKFVKSGLIETLKERFKFTQNNVPKPDELPTKTISFR